MAPSRRLSIRGAGAVVVIRGRNPPTPPTYQWWSVYSGSPLICSGPFARPHPERSEQRLAMRDELGIAVGTGVGSLKIQVSIDDK